MAEPSPKAYGLTAYFFEEPPKTKDKARSIAWQMDHRLQLLNFWDIMPGSRVLELGCGQGDCTVPLADAVGENGHVDAVVLERQTMVRLANDSFIHQERLRFLSRIENFLACPVTCILPSLLNVLFFTPHSAAYTNKPQAHHGHSPKPKTTSKPPPSVPASPSTSPPTHCHSSPPSPPPSHPMTTSSSPTASGTSSRRLFSPA